MFKKILRRFEKLENLCRDNPPEESFKISKRFERLEIGDKLIEIAITDKVSEGEEATAQVTYFYVCPYCGMDNSLKAETCSYCKNNLQGPFPRDYQQKAVLVKVCSNCGAKNLEERKNCWVCGKTLLLSESPKEELQPSSYNVIVLNIDGKEYKSTDANLPYDVTFLMMRIRKEGYRKELVDEWVKERNSKAGSNDAALEASISSTRYSLILRVIGLGIFIIFIFFQARSCFVH